MILAVFTLGIFLFSLGFFSSKGLLSTLMENILYKALTNESRVVEDLQLALEHEGFIALLSGEIRGVSLSATRLAFSDGPVLDNLSFTARGMKLDLGALFYERRLEINRFDRADLSFRLSERELTAAISRDLPHWEPELRISPEEITLAGRINIWNRGLVPFQASVRIEQAAANILRLTPTSLSIAGLDFFDQLLDKYRQELTWEYPVHLPWPLQISALLLEQGFLEMNWKEQTMKGRDER